MLVRTSWRMAHPRFRTNEGGLQLLERAGKLKVDAPVLVRFRCRAEVELVRWILRGAGRDVQRSPGQNVVMNLLSGAAIFEDERDRFRAFRNRGRLRLIGSGV